MARSAICEGGVPLDPDVRKLVEALGVPEVGTTIPYAQLESLLNTPWRSNRFRAVTATWRKKLFRDHNLVLKAIPGSAFEVADSRARLEVTGKTLKRGVRTIARAHVVGATTSRRGLGPDEAKALDHHVSVSATLLQAAGRKPRVLNFTEALQPKK